MVIIVKRFVWNRQNLSHLIKHNVTVEEVEEVFSRYHYIEKTKYRRLLAIGETNDGRVLEIPFVGRGKGHLFVFTAYDARIRKRHHYMSAKIKRR